MSQLIDDLLAFSRIGRTAMRKVPVDLNALFGVFQRLHSATDFEGTGVGLANVRPHRAAPLRPDLGRLRAEHSWHFATDEPRMRHQELVTHKPSGVT